MTDVPKERLAVALHYEKPRAPRVVAMGRGWLGQKIIDIAGENNVPIRESPALAEALAKLKLDEEIPENLYRAVAQVLSFILRAGGHLN
jgi:flagellar biosynthesis protein